MLNRNHLKKEELKSKKREETKTFLEYSKAGASNSFKIKLIIFIYCGLSMVQVVSHFQNLATLF